MLHILYNWCYQKTKTKQKPKKRSKNKNKQTKKQQHFPKSKNRTQFCKFNNKSIIKELGTSESVSNISMPSEEYHPNDF